LARVVFDHIAIGVHRIEDALPFLVGELGGRPAGGGPSGPFVFRQWTFGGGKLEVLEPSGPPNGFLHRFLERRGPGVHHVTFEVPSLDDFCSRAASLGFSVVERNNSDPDWKEAFLHPKGAQSIVVQMVEHVNRSHEEPRVMGPEPGDPEPGSVGIELIGLRLLARDLDRARRLWCGLLQGIGRDLGGDLEVRWPGSVMRLLVSAAGAREEGPLALEIGCLRPAVVPQGRHPALGATFEPIDITLLPPPPVEGETAPPDQGSTALPTEDADTYFLDGEELGLAEQEKP
jgi:catechol 2,3-dioxygenase-like lactoylglutathione lyase family enzyme